MTVRETASTISLPVDPDQLVVDGSADGPEAHHGTGVVAAMLVLTGTAGSAELVAGLDELDGVVKVETSPDRDL